MATVRHVVTGLFVLAAMTASLHADAPSRYREHAMGDQLADVLARTSARPADVRTLHERPALLQSLEWHRPYSSHDEAPDPVKTVTFAFVDGQLYQLTVDYDRMRVGGLTTADLLKGVETVYGPRQATGTPPPIPPGSPAGTVMLGHWTDAEASVMLLRGPYEDLRLVVRSNALGDQAQRAMASAISQDALEAPARRTAAKAAEAAALQDERTKNRTAFKP
ncbi:hypothetical protein [Luteitalea sp.]|jgi:hypothetical protein|uniref:hypothetical protein n=1 Tax=Luteitalea sp. TaxID=2004800 RepID=UPI0037C82BB9